MITGSWVRDRRPRVGNLIPTRLRSVHTLVLVLVLALVVWLGWLWYRSSSFVKVHRVSVVGLSGPDVRQIRSALTDAALTMTTLNVDTSKLQSAVAQYPFVQALTVTRHGAHVLVIHVAEEIPVAVVSIGGNREVVDGNGRLLPNAGVAHSSTLPFVPTQSAPAGAAITAPGPRNAIRVLAAAPYALLAHIEGATSTSAHGVIVQLRDGPQLYFGPVSLLRQKWEAAVAVLGSRYSAGASYLDLTDPQRPAAGAGVSSGQAAALGLVPATKTTAQSTQQPTARQATGQQGQG